MELILTLQHLNFATFIRSNIICADAASAEKAGQFILALLLPSTESFADKLLVEVLDVLEYAVDHVHTQMGFKQVRIIGLVLLTA